MFASLSLYRIGTTILIYVSVVLWQGGDVNNSEHSPSNSNFHMLQQLKEENEQLKERCAFFSYSN